MYTYNYCGIKTTSGYHMAKKSGTVDLNPQFLSEYVTQSGANTYTSKTMILPINPGATISSTGKVRVMELLKIYLDMAKDTLAEDGYALVQLTYKEQVAILTAVDVEKYIVRLIRKTQLITSGAIMEEFPFVLDLTDGQGNGLLIGQQKLFLGVNTAGQGAALSASIKILYRFKDVNVEEYIGMVQGQ
jgi:hypothetical protein